MANVTTHHNDNARTGAYTVETRLTPANVNSGTFGELYSRHVEGDVYTQPLYVHGVATGGGAKNLFYVATSTNMVYAYDADNLATDPATPAVWSRRLRPYRILSNSEMCRETVGSVGVTSTPVIDPATGIMYIVARAGTSPGASDDGANYLHALDIGHGGDRIPPVRISASAAATSPASGTLTFDTRFQRNRPALLLQGGVVYLGWGTFSCDAGPYHGWILGYRASDLAPAAVFCTSTGARAAGVWQSGAGLVGSSDGHIYFATGNEFLLAGSPGPGSPGNLGDSVVRLRPTGAWPGLALAGRFTPRNAGFLRDGYGTPEQFGDTDLGSGGPTLLPNGVLVMGGKQSRIYTLDATTMALRQDSSPPDWQLPGVNPDHIGEGFQAFYNQHMGTSPYTPRALDNFASTEAFGSNIHGNPVYWTGTSCIYHMAEKDHLKAFRYDRTARQVVYDVDPVTKATRPFGESNEAPNIGMPGGSCSISANGDTNGIVWVSYPQNDGQWQKVSGYLVAYAATPGGASGKLLQELWRDSRNVLYAKFNPPTIAEGKVFRATFAPNDAHNNYIGPASVIVYGLTHHPVQRASAAVGLGVAEGGGVTTPPAEAAVEPEPSSPGERAIRDYHLSQGGTAGKLGTPDGPVEDVRNTRGVPGLVQHYRGVGHDPTATCRRPAPGTPTVATVVWSADTGAHALYGATRDRWLESGGAAGEYGFPTAGSTDTSVRFEHGEIRQDPDTD
ncbi:LGFP repeat-containing protein [Actinomadura oligospora]|uniref:LGFP repeat-containing protein n=1 Tax=Actinomadura oligospora TaxID=111804 RepID=UPI0004BBA8A7|nr:hypothetical protein [Actinomadura oligospora]